MHALSWLGLVLVLAAGRVAGGGEEFSDPNETLRRALADPASVTRLDLRGWARLDDEGELVEVRRLAKLPAEIRQLVNLEELDLGGNELTELPRELGALAKLRHLELRRNRLAKLPETFGKLGELEYLGLYGNLFTSFPEEALRDLPKLVVLDISATPIMAVDRVAKFPPALRELRANYTNAGPGWMLPLRRARSLQKLELRFTNGPLRAKKYMQEYLPKVELVMNEYGRLFTPEEMRAPELVRDIDLEKRSLTDLPPELLQFVNLRVLRAGDNEFPKIPEVVFELQKLEVLKLNQNYIKAVPGEISRLARLRELHLERNRLTELSPAVFELPRLEYLCLAGTDLTSLSVARAKLSRLKVLTLGGSEISAEEITSLKRELPHLEEWLDTKRGRDTLVGRDWLFLDREMKDVCASLPARGTDPSAPADPNKTLLKALTNPRGVTKLDLHGWLEPARDGQPGRQCRLREVPKEIGRFKELVELDLGDNNLYTLPPELGSLSRLTRLNLAGNRFARFPAPVLELSALEELSLRRSPFATLPPQLGGLRALKWLDIGQTLVAELPAELAALENLEYLDAYATELKGFPEVLGKLPKLAELDLSGTDQGDCMRLGAGGKRIKICKEITEAVLPPALEVLKLNHTVTGMNAIEPLQSLRRLRRLEVRFSSVDEKLDTKYFKESLPDVELITSRYGGIFYFTELRYPEDLIDLTMTGLVLNDGGIPEEVKQFVNLQTIRLERNRLEEFPRPLLEMPQLEYINLGANDISSLPPELLRMKKLRGLELYANRLTKIPELVLALPRLRYLTLGNNDITALPWELGKLGQLTGFDLGKNPMTRAEKIEAARVVLSSSDSRILLGRRDYDDHSYTLEEALAVQDLKSVRILDLSARDLTKLPVEISKLVGLEMLRIDLNPIASLPKWLARLKELRVIYAYGTKLDAADARQLKRRAPKVRLVWRES